MGKLRFCFRDSNICTAGKQQIWPVCLPQKSLPSSHLAFVLCLLPSVVEKEVELAVGSHSGSEPRLVFGGLVYSRHWFFSQLSAAFLWSSGHLSVEWKCCLISTVLSAVTVHDLCSEPLTLIKDSQETLEKRSLLVFISTKFGRHFMTRLFQGARKLYSHVKGGFYYYLLLA